MNRLRKQFRSMVYAGMQPQVDPLYLHHRTLRQKVSLAGLIAIPCLLVAACVAFAMLGFFDAKLPYAPPPVPALTPVQLAAKMLPNLDGDLRIDVNRDVEVLDVHVEKGSVTRVVGIARNNTGSAIQNAEIVIKLTDGHGSWMGGVSTRIPGMEPKSTAPFSFPVEQRDAVFALVLEIHTP